MPTGWTQSVDLDLDNVSDTPPAPVDDGVYRLQIVKGAPQPTKQGKPSFSLDLRVLREYNGADISDRSPNIRYQSFSLEPTALFRLKNLCKALGVRGPSSTAYDAIEQFCSEIVGQEVWGYVKLDKKGYANVARYLDEEQAAAAVNGLEEAPVRKQRQ